jgi:SpoIID/LytB domain protein
VLNVLSIEDYVRGVVAAEMPSSWHTEALKAQAVAARTYGVRSMNASRYYDICDTTSCQVYRGVAGETKATDTAIAGTKGQILTFEGKPALTQFSSSSGGWSAAGSQSYLASRADEYDDWSGNGVHDWTFTVKASTLEKAYPKIGTLKSLKVTKRSGGGDWGGRVETVVLTGSRASTTLTGPTFRFAVGLRSAWFRFA